MRWASLCPEIISQTSTGCDAGPSVERSNRNDRILSYSKESRFKGIVRALLHEFETVSRDNHSHDENVSLCVGAALESGARRGRVSREALSATGRRPASGGLRKPGPALACGCGIERLER